MVGAAGASTMGGGAGALVSTATAIDEGIDDEILGASVGGAAAAIGVGGETKASGAGRARRCRIAVPTTAPHSSTRPASVASMARESVTTGIPCGLVEPEGAERRGTFVCELKRDDT